jgi:hypothetical protein
MARKLSAKEVAQVEWNDANKSHHNWDEWTNGEAWELTQGEDFTVAVETFRTQAHQAAKRRNMSLSTSKKDNKIVVKFTPKPADDNVVPINGSTES